jgi:hypothetical protein
MESEKLAFCEDVSMNTPNLWMSTEGRLVNIGHTSSHSQKEDVVLIIVVQQFTSLVKYDNNNVFSLRRILGRTNNQKARQHEEPMPIVGAQSEIYPI